MSAELVADRGSPSRRRRFLTFAVVAAAILVIGYGAAGAYAYEQESAVQPHCLASSYGDQTPANFDVIDDVASRASTVDAGPYRFSDFRPVEFPARGSKLTIRGWYAPGRRLEQSPVVILVHGKGSCRRDPKVLLPAGMLHRGGFGVLLIDLRNHGESDVDNGRWAGGDKEFRDVLGAWDWLVTNGHDPRAVGLFGTSLGAAAVTIAMGEESRVASTWSDSGYANFATAIGEYAEERGYPSWIVGSAIPMGRLIGDADLGNRSPDEEVRALNGRSFAIVHGTDDRTILVHHAFDLAAAARAGGTKVDPWIVPHAGHVEAMVLEPRLYEERLVGFFRLALGEP